MNLPKWTTGLLAAVAIGSLFAAPLQAFATDQASVTRQVPVQTSDGATDRHIEKTITFDGVAGDSVGFLPHKIHDDHTVTATAARHRYSERFS